MLYELWCADFAFRGTYRLLKSIEDFEGRLAKFLAVKRDHPHNPHHVVSANLP